MSRSLTRFSILAVVIAIIGIAVKVFLTKPPAPPQPINVSKIDVGLTEEESNHLHHIAQGTNLFPVALLNSLKDKDTGEFMSQRLEHYGFLPSTATKDVNPYGLPVGLGSSDAPFLGTQIPEVGLNCSACHTGELEYEGQKLRIDGAPNMIDIESWSVDMAESAQVVLKDPAEAFEFLIRFVTQLHPNTQKPLHEQLGIDPNVMDLLSQAKEKIKQGPPPPPGLPGPVGAGENLGKAVEIAKHFHQIHKHLQTGDSLPPMAPGDDQGHLLATSKLGNILFLLKERVAFAQKTVDAIKRSPAAGPGRDDAWNLVELMVMNDTKAVLKAPICVPHLFGNAEFEFFHCDSNTTSIMDRNMAQGVALGADVYEDGNSTSIIPRNVNEADLLLEKIQAPQWPEIFPPLDQTLAEQGKTLFEKKIHSVDGTMMSCQDCHGKKEGKTIPIDHVKTNPIRWATFNVKTPERDGPEMLMQLWDKVKLVKSATMQLHNVPNEEWQSWERKEPIWRTSDGYVARYLAGIWASPPYLHNGSVRTLYQLLLPEDQREKSFYVGSRKFDPKEVGYSNTPGPMAFEYDTSKAENTNTGHNFGAHLTDDERYALIEYLKSL